MRFAHLQIAQQMVADGANEEKVREVLGTSVGAKCYAILVLNAYFPSVGIYNAIEAKPDLLKRIDYLRVSDLVNRRSPADEYRWKIMRYSATKRNQPWPAVTSEAEVAAWFHQIS